MMISDIKIQINYLLMKISEERNKEKKLLIQIKRKKKKKGSRVSRFFKIHYLQNE